MLKTFTVIFEPLFWPSIAQTNASGITFFLIAHSTTFLGTPSNALSRST